jgi:hypothetical protein
VEEGQEGTPRTTRLPEFSLILAVNAAHSVEEPLLHVPNGDEKS